MKLDYSEIFPIKAIEDNLLVRRNGDITAGIIIAKPEVYSISIAEANSTNEMFRDILKLLPNGSVLHMQDFYYVSNYKSDFKETDKYILRSNLRYYNERPVLNHYCRMYITLTVNDEKVERSPEETSFKNISDWIVKKPFAKLKKSIEDIDNLVDTVISKLNNVRGWRGQRMDNSQLGCALYDYCNLSYNEPCESFEDKSLQPLEYDLKTCVYGKKFLRVLSLKEEGDKLFSLNEQKTASGFNYKSGVDYNAEIKLKTSIVFPIGLGLPINHVLNTIIQRFDSDTFLKFLDKKYKQLNIAKTLVSKEGLNVQKEIKDFQDQIVSSALDGCITKVNMILHDEKYEGLMQNIGLSENAFLNMRGAKCNIEIGADVPSLFFACIPGNAIENYRYFLNTAPQAVNYISKESPYKNDLSGHIFVDRFSKPVVVNMWDSKLIVNRNKVIIGPSGTGKSFSINGLVSQSHAQGNDVILVDIGGSYKRTCEFIAGKYFDSNDLKSFAFNPFLCEKDEKGNYRYKYCEDEEEGDEEIINQVVQVISNIWKGSKSLTDEQGAILKNMVIAFYEYVNKEKKFPCISEFYDYTKKYESQGIKETHKKYFDFESLRLIIKPFAKGEYSFLLNAKENIDIIKDSFIVFDLEGIKANETLTNIVALLIMQLVINKFKRRKGVRKTLVIDEAIDFLKHEKMGDFIAYLYRTARKKDAEVCLALQNVLFFEECAKLIRDSILINSDTRLLLSHKNYKSSYDDLVRLSIINTQEIEILDSVQDKEFFLKMGEKSAIYKHDVSKEVEYIFTSRQNEVLEIEKMQKQLGSVQAAVKNYTIKKEKENEEKNN